MKISLIIPTYNSECYLEKMIDSIRRVPWYEIIFVDDGSQDKTIKILRLFSQTASNVQILQNSHNGVSVSRNLGMASASGDYVMFMDSDDILLSSKFLNFLKTTDNNSDIISFTHTAIKEHIWQLSSRNRQRVIGNILKLPSQSQFDTFIIDPGPCSRLYKRSLISNNHLKFDAGIEFGEDLLFNLKAINCAKSFTVIPIGIYLYRYNKQSVSRGFNYDQILNLKLFFNALEPLIDERLISERRALSFIRSIKKSIVFDQAISEQNKLVDYYQKFSMKIDSFSTIQKIFYWFSINRHFETVRIFVKFKNLFTFHKRNEFSLI